MTSSIKCVCGMSCSTPYHYRQHQQKCELSSFKCVCGAKYFSKKSLSAHTKNCKQLFHDVSFKQKISEEAKFVNSNEEIFAFICKYYHNIGHISNKKTFKEKVKKFSGIDIPEFDNMEDLYCYLTKTVNSCEMCGNKRKLKSFSSGLKQFCSKECHLKWRSIRQSNDNTIHRLRDRKTWSENVSKRIKKSILDGKFTPNVTNSWCHSRKKVIIGNRIINVRSSWEEKFLLMNPSFFYEKTRIPYVDMHGESHTYIVDFTDADGNLYEIKPSSKLGECSEKVLAAKNFASINNVHFYIVTEKILTEMEKIQKIYKDLAFDTDQPFLQQIYHLVKNNSNDAELGSEVRLLIKRFEEAHREKIQEQLSKQLQKILNEN